MDWGTARRLTAQIKLSGIPVSGRPGRMIGTPAFMAPEQLRGRYDQLDQRTDVFGVGAVLYSIMTKLARPSRAARPGRRSRRRGAGLSAWPRAICSARYCPCAASSSGRRRGGRATGMARCSILKRDLETGGGERVLREMGPRGVFGETAALAGGLRTATVTAVGEVIGQDRQQEDPRRITWARTPPGSARSSWRLRSAFARPTSGSRSSRVRTSTRARAPTSALRPASRDTGARAR